MIGGINQSSSTVGRDQIGRDQINLNVIEVEKKLAPAINPIRKTNISLKSFMDDIFDEDNTVLITKLTNGGFNSVFKHNAKVKKMQTMSLIVSMTKTEYGKAILNDVYDNLLTVINMKYIATLNDGDTLKTSITTILNDLGGIVEKYINIIDIDEAFLEGLLYVATSRCALKWKMEDGDENENDN
ncbi:MAG: hypothetical protein K0R15_1622 [Clostridiales bacterium]|jgi:hypothetical protein|nr:hypothetical protein [Clostridiales bacterium]